MHSRFKELEHMDLLKVARWAYKIGEPIMSDYTYDNIEKILKSKFPDNKIFNTSYDDDDEPVDILNKYNITDLFINKVSETLRIKKYRDLLHENKSLSIKATRSYEEAYQWFQKYEGVELIFSPKLDGINTKSLYDVQKNEILVASSRGSHSLNLWDYTDTFLSIYNLKFKKIYLNISTGITPLYFEGIISEKGRQKLNKITGKNYVNAKTASLAILRTGLVKGIEKEFKIIMHGCDDGSETLKQSYDNFKEAGFDVVNYRIETFKDSGLENFKEWVQEIQSSLNSKASELDLVYDGVVARINNNKEYYSENYNEMYSEGCIALKFGENNADEYDAIVKDVDMNFASKSHAKYTTKVILEPFTTKDNKTIKEVTGYNLDYVIKNKIYPGTKIKVIYQSQCYPIIKEGPYADNKQ